MIFAFVLVAFALLAAGTYRQSATLFGRAARPVVRRVLLGAGYLLLIASLAMTLAGDDPSRALVEWFGELTVAAVVLLVLGWLWPRR